MREQTIEEEQRRTAPRFGEAARALSPVQQVPCAYRCVCNRYGCGSVRRCWRY